MLIFGDDDPFAPIPLGTTQIYTGDCRTVLAALPDNSMDCCITSPPYYNLRNYKNDNQIGLEETPQDYVIQLVNVFHAVWRVLKDDATLWLNLGDSYARNGGSDQTISKSAMVGSTRNTIIQRGNRKQTVPNGLKSKDLIMIPARVAIALQDAGWYLRSDIIWNKPNCMPESVIDRPTSSYEHVFLFSKKPDYFYDADAIREPHNSSYSRDVISKAGMTIGGERPDGNNFNKQVRHETGETTPATRADRAALLNPKGRNSRNVWSINTAPYRGAHFATMPEALVERCVRAGTCEKGHCPACKARWRRVDDVWHADCGCGLDAVPDVVLDPFGGAGTTALVAQRLGRNATIIELNERYASLARQRVHRLPEKTTPEELLPRRLLFAD